MNRKPLSNEDISHICRSLSLLLHAGLTMADGVFLLRQEDSRHRELLQFLGAGLDGGRSLSDTMEETGAFPPSVPAMVRIGEETGRLEEALTNLADYYDQRCHTARLLQNAVAYPGMTLALMLVVVGVLLTSVLPVFDDVYASLGSRLTGISALLLHLGQGLKAILPLLFWILAVVAVLAVLVSRWTGFREKVLIWYQKSFGDRGISRRFHNARFARGLAMGLGSGLTLEESVKLAAMLLQDSPGAAKRCALCAEKLEKGETLADALGESGLLDAYGSRMLSVGIRGGNGDAVMADIAEKQMASAEEALESTIAKIEPAMVLTASILVGLILLSVMLPLMDILSAIG